MLPQRLAAELLWLCRGRSELSEEREDERQKLVDKLKWWAGSVAAPDKCAHGANESLPKHRWVMGWWVGGWNILMEVGGPGGFTNESLPKHRWVVGWWVVRLCWGRVLPVLLPMAFPKLLRPMVSPRC